tara:strand:- start:194 stop:754 length:561 start_codon:yes stop_codon:yes gene_type:complete
MEVLSLELMSLKLLLEKGIETMVDVEKMIEDNERLVRKIAHNMYVQNGLFSCEDLYQVGLMSVWRNGSKYNSKRGRISTFLTHCVKNDILKFIKNQKLSVTNKLGKVERAKLFDNDLSVSYKDETLDVTYDVEDYFNLKNDSERKVIKLKVDGYNNSYIAKQLNMHPNKVASVINKVAERYKASNE